MRRFGPMIHGLWTVLLVGCLSSGSTRTTSWLDRLHPFRPAAAADAIPVDVAILESPIADSFVNQGLWDQADEQVVAFDRKAVLDDNGFRVGQFGDVMPARLQAMLNTERSCASKRRYRVRSGEPITIALGPDRSTCRCELHQDGHKSAIEFTDAQCCFRVAASTTRDGSTQLHFTPLLRHGQRRPVLQASTARDSVVFDEQRPIEEYRALSWDVTLAANQFVVIGTRSERANTLGYECFFRPDESRAVQRLLVIWPGHVAPAAGTETASGSADSQRRSVPTIAEQAAWATTRGQSR